VRGQAPAERQQVLDHLEAQLADFLSDSKESAAFTESERREVEKDVQQARKHCDDLLLNMETGGTRTHTHARTRTHTHTHTHAHTHTHTHTHTPL